MKKLMLALTLLGSSSAFAGSLVQSCTNADGTDKLALYANANGSYVAVLTTEVEGGGTDSFKYGVKPVFSGAIGGPMIYQSKKLKIELYGAQAPVKGHMRAHLTVKSLSIDEDVYCKL